MIFAESSVDFANVLQKFVINYKLNVFLLLTWRLDDTSSDRSRLVLDIGFEYSIKNGNCRVGIISYSSSKYSLSLLYDLPYHMQ